MKKDILYIVGLFLLIIALLIINSSANLFLRDLTPQAVLSTRVKIDNLEITAEVAKNPQTRAKGLSEKEKLAENSGMVFVFDEVDRYRFWMKNVKFPIDIIWIGKNKRIVDITPNAKPEQSVPDNLLRIYQPAEPVLYVLELPSGTATANDIKIGDLVEFEI